MELIDVTLVPEDDPIARCISVKVEDKRPVSSETQSIEIQRFMCSFCKKDFNSEEEYDIHVETEHQGILIDDKEALKKTSELTAALNAIFTENPEILELQKGGEEKKEVIDVTMNTTEKESTQDDSNTSPCKIVIEIKEGRKHEFKCDDCVFSSDSNRSIRMHKKNKHGIINNTTCSLCPMMFKTEESFLHHINKKHYKANKCTKCDFKTKSLTLMKTHERKHHREPHKCDECNEEFKLKMELVYHKRTHVAAFKCDKCIFKGTSMKALVIHKNKNHIQNITPQRGTKRDPNNQSPSETINELQNKDPMKQMKKKIKTNNKVKQHINIKLPVKESEVIGGAGWGLKEKENETTQSKVDTKAKKNNENVIIHEMFAPLPNVVLCTLPEHKDSILRPVLGDGTCCMRCIAVHLEMNEDEGPKLSKQYNNFLSKNREYASKFVSFPKTITISTPNGKKEVTFEDTEEEKTRYFDFLDTDEAIHVWREGEDMLGLATFFNIQLEVVVIKRSGEVELPVNTYGPDGDYEQTQEKKSKITLLNSADHFNLIIKQQNDQPKPKYKIAETQENALPIISTEFKCKFCEKTGISNEQIENHIEQIHSNEIIRELRAELSKLKNLYKSPKQKPKTPELEQSMTQNDQWIPVLSHKFHNNPNPQAPQQQQQNKPMFRFTDYLNCDKCSNVFSSRSQLEAHIKNKHTGIETTPPDNVFKTLKAITCNECGEEFDTKSQLRNHMNRVHQKLEASPMETEEEIERSQERKYICKVCKVERNTQNKLERHLANHNDDGDWFCESCPFQTNDMKLLKVHMKEKQHIFDLLQVQEVKCTFCENMFKSKTDMKTHRKEIHKTFRPCRNPIACVFKEECVFNHDPIPDGLHRCFQCGKDFKTKNEMMIHRKIHVGVRICKNFLNNTCSRGSECWWNHNVESHPTTQNSGFQQNPGNLAPPDPQVKSMKPIQIWPQPKQTKSLNHIQPNQVQTNQDQPTITKMMNLMEQNLTTMKNMWNMINQTTKI